MMKHIKKKSIIILIGLVIIFIVSQFLSKRFDLTQDKRYTLTETSNNVLKDIDKSLEIDILLGGELTGNYRILKNEIQFLLDEIKQKNPKVNYRFVDPLEMNASEMEKFGIIPIPIKTDKGVLNIYPYARLSYGDKVEWMEVLINDPSIPFNDLAIASTEKLEYLFAERFKIITNTNRKKIGFIVHNDELPQQNIEGLGRALAKKYDVEVYLNPILNKKNTLDIEDIDSLKQFDGLIVAKPTLPFTDKDKIVLDQYIMNGGKMLWAIETVDAEMDSIFRSGKIVAFPRDLKLTDFMFNYGIRLHNGVIKDLNGAKIVLADGETAGNVSYNYYTWPYFELGLAGETNPITASIDPVLFNFANPIELLQNPNVKPTVLLSTSPQTSIKPSLNFITLNEVDIEDIEEYKMGKIPMAVLLEGNFTSAYANRIERKEIPNYKNKTVNGKMIVISDGDVLKNNLWRGMPMQLGEDKFSVRPDNPDARPITYANQTFLLNSMDYLLGDEDFLVLRNRKLEIPLLSETKVLADKETWQKLNLIIPISIILLLGVGAFFLRKKLFK